VPADIVDSDATTASADQPAHGAQDPAAAIVVPALGPLRKMRQRACRDVADRATEQTQFWRRD